MVNIANLVKQAKEMQEKVAQTQEALATEIVIGTAGGDTVKIKMNGRKYVEDIEINDEVLKDKEELVDLLVAACRDAAEKADALTEKRLADSTGGFNLPKGVSFPV
ncbi:MAG: YbaB/EbfC family nucleoid-associated protein [Alphaproteobacteria bacterium]|nr:YbaB/EbfC family nucleoid-associated protein [Alphaproteobacteria bacterium]